MGAGAASGASVQKKEMATFEQTLACTAGTSLGEKLKTAASTCGFTTMRIEEKLQLSRQDNVCYSYADIMDWVRTRYAGDLCVLQSIGWLDKNMNANKKLIASDITSLDPVVTAPLVGGHRVCIAMVMDEVEGHECLTNGAYTEGGGRCDGGHQKNRQLRVLHGPLRQGLLGLPGCKQQEIRRWQKKHGTHETFET